MNEPVNLAELAAANQDRVNQRVIAAGRCVMHNPDVTIAAVSLVTLPIGNVIALCDACREWWIAEAEASGDRLMRPVSVVDVP